MKRRKKERITKGGITFDNEFQAYIYQLLADKCHASKGETSTLREFPIDYFGRESPPTNVCTRTRWYVDFLVLLEATASSGAKSMQPFFAVETKDSFQPVDSYRFLLWDIYQLIPLIVVYQDKLPGTLQTGGLIEFVHWSTFRDNPIGPTVIKRREANEQRRGASLPRLYRTPPNGIHRH